MLPFTKREIPGKANQFVGMEVNKLSLGNVELKMHLRYTNEDSKIGIDT